MSNTNRGSDQDCEHLKHCVVWSKFSTDSKLVWIKSYCQGAKKDQCARKKQKANGEFLPDELLPNGTYLNPEGVSTKECEKLVNCPVWKDFKTDGKMIWIRAYCQGPKQGDCVRKSRSAKGLSVPNDLLPNGSSLK
jgi:hypothetical protein